MKRVIILLSFVSFQLGAISVAEYIAQHGQPAIRESEGGKLDLSRKQITSLEGLELLQDPLAVWRLDLSANQITTVPSGIFNRLRNLQNLDLNGNQLTTLPTGIFKFLGKLQFLVLANNPLTTLPEGIFDSLNNLMCLKIRDTQLPETRQQFRAKYLANRGNVLLEFKTQEQEAEAIQKDIFKTLQELVSQNEPSRYTTRINAIKRLVQDIKNQPAKNHMAAVRDEHGNTLMHLAIMTGHYELIKLLANTLPEFLILKNEQGETPLHTAIFLLPDSNTRKIIKFLVEKKPKKLIDIKNKAGQTPIDLAVGHNREMVDLLLNIAHKTLPQESQASTSYKKESKP